MSFSMETEAPGGLRLADLIQLHSLPQKLMDRSAKKKTGHHNPRQVSV